MLQIAPPFKGNYRVSFKFGENLSWYVKVFGYPHSGTDFAMPVGTPIRACDNGRIAYADFTPDSNGLGININHEWGMSQYWHLSSILAKVNTYFERGQVIGFSGNTGFSTGPHLHFGIKVDGDVPAGMRGWTDPQKYIIGTEPIPDPLPIKPRTYIVRPGDTLWKIAVKFYNDGYQWRKIYQMNSDKIKDPALIWPLQILQIPG